MLSGSLKKLRKERGLSQQELSDRIGIKRATYARYETGENQPGVKTLRKISDFFGVSMEYLVNNDDFYIDNAKQSSDNLLHTDESLDLGETYPMGGLTMIPIVAEISCGEPIFTESNVVGYFPVDSQLFDVHGSQDEYVYMRAVGNSMINALISDGSMVLLRLQNTAENGDIVAVCVDSERATLKRIYYGNGVITLAPENSAMKPTQYEPRRIRVVAKALWTASHL